MILPIKCGCETFKRIIYLTISKKVKKMENYVFYNVNQIVSVKCVLETPTVHFDYIDNRNGYWKSLFGKDSILLRNKNNVEKHKDELKRFIIVFDTNGKIDNIYDKATIYIGFSNGETIERHCDSNEEMLAEYNTIRQSVSPILVSADNKLVVMNNNGKE
jgi:hypothetical protein